jgi:two-component system, NarL family, sensor histidine kinase DegS
MDRTRAEQHVSRRELRRLKWLSALFPPSVVLVYETARQEALEHLFPALPGQYINLIVWGLLLLLTYAFAAFVFRIVERLQVQALAKSRDVATLSAVLEERARLSRELHDGLAQLVTSLLVRLDTVSDLVRSTRTGEALSELEGMRSMTDDLYQDVRESISDLRTRVSQRGLPATLRDYVDAFEDRHGITVTLDERDVPSNLEPLVAFQLLRIVQEALANVRKHASARNAWVGFQRSGDQLELEIRDDGAGFDPEAAVTAARESVGLASMRERAEALGGELRIDSQVGKGTAVRVILPTDSTLEETGFAALAPAAR